MEGIATQFTPKPLYSEPLIGYGDLETYILRCGRLVFMEQIGEQKVSIKYNFNNGLHYDLFGRDCEETKPLFQVVKVTFCPTVKIAKAVAEKYPAQGIDLIYMDGKDLKTVVADIKNKEKKKSFFGRVFGF